MPQPQQPELRRSEEHAAVDHHTKSKIGAGPTAPPADDPALATPEANQPGHHPDRDQDKPDGAAFAARFGIPLDEAAPEDDTGGQAEGSTGS